MQNIECQQFRLRFANDQVQTNDFHNFNIHFRCVFCFSSQFKCGWFVCIECYSSLFAPYLLCPTRCGHIEFGSITERCYDSDASRNCCFTSILRLHLIRPIVYTFVCYSCMRFGLRLCVGWLIAVSLWLSFIRSYAHSFASMAIFFDRHNTFHDCTMVLSAATQFTVRVSCVLVFNAR